MYVSTLSDANSYVRNHVFSTIVLPSSLHSKVNIFVVEHNQLELPLYVDIPYQHLPPDELLFIALWRNATACSPHFRPHVFMFGFIYQLDARTEYMDGCFRVKHSQCSLDLPIPPHPLYNDYRRQYDIEGDIPLDRIQLVLLQRIQLYKYILTPPSIRHLNVHHHPRLDPERLLMLLERQHVLDDDLSYWAICRIVCGTDKMNMTKNGLFSLNRPVIQRLWLKAERAISAHRNGRLPPLNRIPLPKHVEKVSVEEMKRIFDSKTLERLRRWRPDYERIDWIVGTIGSTQWSGYIQAMKDRTGFLHHGMIYLPHHLLHVVDNTIHSSNLSLMKVKANAFWMSDPRVNHLCKSTLEMLLSWVKERGELVTTLPLQGLQSQDGTGGVSLDEVMKVSPPCMQEYIKLMFHTGTKQRHLRFKQRLALSSYFRWMNVPIGLIVHAARPIQQIVYGDTNTADKESRELEASLKKIILDPTKQWSCYAMAREGMCMNCPTDQQDRPINEWVPAARGACAKILDKHKVVYFRNPLDFAKQRMSAIKS